MTDLSERWEAQDLGLRSWDEYAASMRDCLKDFGETLREHILIALYHRAWQKVWLEQLRSEERLRPALLRRERASAERNRRQIQKALESLEDAIESLEKIGADKTIVASRGLDHIRAARTSLQQAAQDWRFLEELLIGLIHPKLRNKTEKARNIESARLETWRLFPGFGVAKIKQMFIERTESYLSTLVRPNGSRLSSARIDGIIAATFDAAFGEMVDLETVKTMRRRLRDR